MSKGVFASGSWADMTQLSTKAGKTIKRIRQVKRMKRISFDRKWISPSLAGNDLNICFDRWYCCCTQTMRPHCFKRIVFIDCNCNYLFSVLIVFSSKSANAIQWPNDVMASVGFLQRKHHDCHRTKKRLFLLIQNSNHLHLICVHCACFNFIFFFSSLFAHLRRISAFHHGSAIDLFVLLICQIR